MRPSEKFPPAVVVMTSFLERSIDSLRTATGIAYEVPAVSSIVALREVSETSVERVGVVYRKTFSDVIKKQADLAKIEKVELISVAVSDQPTKEEVEDSLDLLVVDKKVDALWVLNDNKLLSAELLVESWLPVLRFKPIPVIVGVSALVHPDIHFGTLAVLPHHAQLGVQAADLVFELADNEWQLENDRDVELPLSVMTVVDVRQVDDFFGLKPDALAKIDKAIK
jgi:putative ABC transport system substrate-binding protein